MAGRLLRASQYRALALMYLSQALPTGLAFAALGALIRDAGHGVAAVGWTGLAFIPWALRFLWASAVDNACARRGHGAAALALQALMAALCLLLAPLPPAASLGAALAAVVALNTVAATQGIVTNAYAVAHLQDATAPVNAIQVAGYGLGMVLGGGGFLVAHGTLGWAGAAQAMAALLVLAGGVLWADGRWRGVRAAGAGQAGAVRLRDLREHRDLALALLVALGFKVASHAVGTLVQPWLVDRGWSIAAIGRFQMVVIAAVSLGGVAVGVPLVRWLGHRGAVLASSVAVALLMGAGWVLQRFALQAPWLHYAAFGVQGVFEGALFVAAWALLMRWASPERPGTDYATLQCTESLGAMAIAGGIGVLAQALGYGGAFGLAWLAAGGSVLLLAACLPRLRLQGEGPG